MKEVIIPPATSRSIMDRGGHVETEKRKREMPRRALVTSSSDPLTRWKGMAARAMRLANAPSPGAAWRKPYPEAPIFRMSRAKIGKKLFEVFCAIQGIR